MMTDSTTILRAARRATITTAIPVQRKRVVIAPREISPDGAERRKARLQGDSSNWPAERCAGVASAWLALFVILSLKALF